MTEMPALSLWQPWASLLVTRQLCRCVDVPLERWRYEDCGVHRMVKRFETRSWPCPPSLIGQRFAIHAALRKPDELEVGDYAMFERQDGTWGLENWRTRAELEVDLPLGAIVGSGVVAACYPIVGSPLFGVEHILRSGDRLYLERYPTGPEGGKSTEPISGQLPYGDFTPGRFAWLIEDAATTTERCPWCSGGPADRGPDGSIFYCSVCDGAGRCEPIPAKGRQRIWHWTPEAAA